MERPSRKQTKNERNTVSRKKPKNEDVVTPVVEKEKVQEEESGLAGKQEKELSTIIQQELQCGICLDVVQIQGTLDCCSHAFCFACIETWMKTANICPMCKATVKKLTKKDSTGNNEKTTRVKTVDRRSENSEMSFAELLQFAFPGNNEDSDDDDYDPHIALPSLPLFSPATFLLSFALAQYARAHMVHSLLDSDSEDDEFDIDIRVDSGASSDSDSDSDSGSDEDSDEEEIEPEAPVTIDLTEDSSEEEEEVVQPPPRQRRPAPPPRTSRRQANQRRSSVRSQGTPRSQRPQRTQNSVRQQRAQRRSLVQRRRN